MRAGHRDSGRVNQELQDDGGNPRVSLKVGFIITDTTERTGFQAIPGTHLGSGVKGGQVDMSPDEPWSLSDGDPPSAYIADSTPLFERTALVAAQPNRAVIYRSSLLHSGAIAPGAALGDDPARGRLTVTAFLMLE